MVLDTECGHVGGRKVLGGRRMEEEECGMFGKVHRFLDAWVLSETN